MDNNQKRIFEWLKEQDECIGELYEAAVRMVEDDSLPGRKRLICHAVREIRNRLPEKVGAEGIRKRVDYTNEVEEETKKDPFEENDNSQEAPRDSEITG